MTDLLPARGAPYVRVGSFSGSKAPEASSEATGGASVRGSPRGVRRSDLPQVQQIR